jgi:hypothetical protein
VEEAQECVTAIDNTQLKLGSKFFTLLMRMRWQIPMQWYKMYAISWV